MNRPSLKEIREARASAARRTWFGPVALAALLSGAAKAKLARKAEVK